MLSVTIFNEFYHEKTEEEVKRIYPEGIHIALKNYLQSEDIVVNTVTLDDENCGLSEEILLKTDVLIWWGHMLHHKVPDEVAELVAEHVRRGMGAIFLHSGHHSKPFKKLMGTTCNLMWREDGDKEILWVVNPAHPIAKGIDKVIKLDHEETYGEPFSVPEPDELVFIGSFEGGEVFRAGCCYKRQNGKIFYFQPGHESYPNLHNSEIIKVIRNAIFWAAPTCEREPFPEMHLEIKNNWGK